MGPRHSDICKATNTLRSTLLPALFLERETVKEKETEDRVQGEETVGWNARCLPVMDIMDTMDTMDTQWLMVATLTR